MVGWKVRTARARRPSQPMIARIKKHQRHNGILLIDVPVELNDVMGRFGPARLSIEDRAYLVETEHFDTLSRHLARHNCQIVDERAKTSNNPSPNPLPECVNCGQPAKRDNPPAYCPACGDAWQPLYVTGTTHDWRRQASCPACHVSQPDGFPRCGACGAHMPPPRPLARPSVNRPNLPDPMPFSETIDEWAATARQARDQHKPAPEAAP